MTEEAHWPIHVVGEIYWFWLSLAGQLNVTLSGHGELRKILIMPHIWLTGKIGYNIVALACTVTGKDDSTPHSIANSYDIPVDIHSAFPAGISTAHCSPDAAVSSDDGLSVCSTDSLPLLLSLPGTRHVPDTRGNARMTEHNIPPYLSNLQIYRHINTRRWRYYLKISRSE